MSQAMQTRDFARSARRGEKKKSSGGKESIVLALPPTYSHKLIMTHGGDIKRANEKWIHYSKLVIFLATRNTDNSINHRK